MRMIWMTLAAAALSGCMPEPDAPPADQGTAPSGCGAAGLDRLVGETADAQDFSAFGADTRILPPDAAMTMDHRPDRLNVDVDADGRITRLWCG